jgi:alpha-1,2-mannosyltransferase
VAIVVALGIFAFLLTAMIVTHLAAPHVGMFADLLGRLANLQNLRATGNIYAPFGIEAFTYPPGAVLIFWPILWLNQSLIPLTWTVISLAALVGTLFVALTYLGRKGASWNFATACWIAVTSVAVFPPVLEDLGWGQTGTILLLLVVLDSLAIRGKTKGVFIGLATAFKIYPGVFIVVFLMRRQWRAAFNATATAAATTGLAWILWPKSATYFFSKEFFGGGELAHFAGGTQAAASSSLVDFLFRAPFRISPNSYETIVVFLLVLIIGLIAARNLWRRGYELSSMLIALIVSIVGAPIAWDHYFVFVPLLCLVPLEMGWHHALSRTAIATAAMMVVPWFNFRRPTPGSWWISTYVFISRNAILFGVLALLAVATFDAVRSAPRRIGRRVCATQPGLVPATQATRNIVRPPSRRLSSANATTTREKPRTPIVTETELSVQRADGRLRIEETVPRLLE